MTTFTLTIELGNDAMKTATDLSAAIKLVAARVKGADVNDETVSKVRDENGNTVGVWRITP